jgi:hypothetical protein
VKNLEEIRLELVEGSIVFTESKPKLIRTPMKQWLKEQGQEMKHFSQCVSAYMEMVQIHS